MSVSPPQIIIFVPVQTAAWPWRAVGAPVVVVAVHELPGSYCPPALRYVPSELLAPPQTIIREPVQTAVWPSRPVGAPSVVVAVQELPTGSYSPPVSVSGVVRPPQMIIFEPVQTAVWE